MKQFTVFVGELNVGSVYALTIDKAWPLARNLLKEIVPPSMALAIPVRLEVVQFS